MDADHFGLHTSRFHFAGLLHHLSQRANKYFSKNQRSECPVIGVSYATATVAASPTRHPENIVMVLKRIALSLLAVVAFGATARCRPACGTIADLQRTRTPNE